MTLELVNLDNVSSNSKVRVRFLLTTYTAGSRAANLSFVEATATVRINPRYVELLNLTDIERESERTTFDNRYVEIRRSDIVAVWRITNG